MKLSLGTKYQYYLGDELKVIRVCGFKNNETAIGIDDKGEKFTIKDSDLDEMVALEPDAFINTMITTATINGEKVLDVYVCVDKASVSKPEENPCCILRQGTYSISKNALSDITNSDFYMGDCFTSSNYPLINGGGKLTDLFEFEDIEYSVTMSSYIDDKLSDIVEIIGKNKKINHALETMYEENQKLSNGSVKGYTKTLEDLLLENNFMFNFRLAFNIGYIDFLIELEDGSNIEDGVIKFNKKQHGLFETYLGEYVKDVNILKYDKDIDLSKIVEHPHIVVSDPSDNIYLIGYIISGVKKLDPDIKKAFNMD